MIKRFEKLIAPYPQFRKFYAIKKKIFPIQTCLDVFPDKGTLVDLGCGNGLFSGLLGMNYPQMKITGIDNDEKKINQARIVFKDLGNVQFQKGNIVDISYPGADHFCLIDVLYLIPFELHELILSKIHRAMPPKGILIVKEMDSKPYFKRYFNMLQETISVKLIKRTLGNRFYFRNSEKMIALFKKAGFIKTSVYRVDKGYWYPHIIYTALKK